MIEIYAFQSPIAYIHLILCVLTALQLRHFSRIDYLTVFPWIMLIVYGHPFFGGTVFILVFTAILTQTHKMRPTNWRRIVKLITVISLSSGVWLWVNTRDVYLGYGYPIWYGIATAIIGIILAISHLLLIRYALSGQEDSVPSIYKYTLTIILEVLISLFLWTLMITTIWNVLANSWFYVVLPLWVFGIAASVLTHKLHQFRVQHRYPLGLWRYSPSIVTFLWSALVVLVPVVGPTICLLLYPRLTHPHPNQRETAARNSNRVEA